MPIITDEIKERLAFQTPLIHDFDKLKAIAKVINPAVDFSFYLLCFRSTEKSDVYAYIDGSKAGFIFIGLEEVNTNKISGFPFEIDKKFKECDLMDLLKVQKENKALDTQKKVDEVIKSV